LLSLIFAIADARLRRIAILIVMLVSGLLSNPLYRSLHLHATIAYYLAFFLAGFLVCDLYLTRSQWNPSFAWDALALGLWPLVWIMGRNSGHVLLPFVSCCCISRPFGDGFSRRSSATPSSPTLVECATASTCFTS